MEAIVSYRLWWECICESICARTTRAIHRFKWTYRLFGTIIIFVAFFEFFRSVDCIVWTVRNNCASCSNRNIYTLQLSPGWLSCHTVLRCSAQNIHNARTFYSQLCKGVSDGHAGGRPSEWWEIFIYCSRIVNRFNSLCMCVYAEIQLRFTFSFSTTLDIRLKARRANLAESIVLYSRQNVILLYITQRFAYNMHSSYTLTHTRARAFAWPQTRCERGREARLAACFSIHSSVWCAHMFSIFRFHMETDSRASSKFKWHKHNKTNNVWQSKCDELRYIMCIMDLMHKFVFKNRCHLNWLLLSFHC